MTLSFVISCALLALPLSRATVIPRGGNGVAYSNVAVIQSNDDGWFEGNLRALYFGLQESGFDTAISAPAIDRSGTGSSDKPPTTLTTPGEFGSLPVGAPAIGSDPIDNRVFYVNSFPVTAMRYGIQTVAAEVFGYTPELAVSGPNVGANRGATTKISGTFGAANEALLQGVPAIAFSGDDGPHKSYLDITLQDDPSLIYASLAIQVINAVTASKPFLPRDIGLNVNFPSTKNCPTMASYSFIFSRIFASTGSDDVSHCKKKRLPTEEEVAAAGACFISISGFNVGKTDISAKNQALVRDKLLSLWSCL